MEQVRNCDSRRRKLKVPSPRAKSRSAGKRSNARLSRVSGIALGKHNIKDPRLDQADKLVEAQKKTYAQADVVEEKEMLISDAILTTRSALSDLLMKDLEAVETRLGRDATESEKSV